MTRFSPPPVSPSRTWKCNPLATATALLVALLSLPAAAELQPHTATYHSTSHGLSVTLEQSLTAIGDNRWQLHNHSGILFADVDETAVFEIRDNSVRPLTYDFHNDLSDRKNSELRFDWSANTVVDEFQQSPPLVLTEPAWDSLSYQVQLRLQLMNEPLPLEQTNFPLVVRDDLKHYQVTTLGEERLDSKVGVIDTLKLKQQRPGKDEYTLIWLARDWDYAIVRLQRIDEGDVKYQIDLRHLQLGDRSLGKKS